MCKKKTVDDAGTDRNRLLEEVIKEGMRMTRPTADNESRATRTVAIIQAAALLLLAAAVLVLASKA